MQRVKVSYPTIIGFCAVILAILNMVQARQISQLAAQLENASNRNVEKRSPGSIIKAFSLQSPGGRSVQIDFESMRQGTVLYVFSPSCHWCIRNAGIETELAKKIKDKYTVIGISLSGAGLTDFIERYHPEFSQYGVASAATQEQLRLSVTPALIVVGRDRRVKKVWTGAFFGRTKDTIEDYFSTKLETVLASE